MKTIVLVEDNDANQLIIQDICEFDLANVRLVRFSTAEEAIDKVPALQPDLVLMDVALPGMTGIEAAQRLKASYATRHIPIWALTAHAMKGDRESAMQLGFEDYLTKPVDLTTLRQRLRQALRCERPAEAHI